MKDKIKNFYNAYKYPTWWTLWYVVATYLILKLMFNFDIFSGAQWTRLMHAHLHGFPGMVFGILMLAAVPLYVATTAIIVRTGKPLITIPMPKIPNPFRTAPAPAPEPEPAVNTFSVSQTPESGLPQPELPPDMPREMRAPYIRARKYGSEFAIPQTAQTAALPQSATTDTGPDVAMPGDLPIPTDFDFDPPATDNGAAMPNFVPVFSDIEFNTDAPATTDTDTPDSSDSSDNPDDYNAAVLAHLAAGGRTATVDNGMVVCDDMVIASHTDPEFWIMDEDTWFAPGKSRPSPIAALTTFAATNDLRPILYLGATNIMDFDARRAAWESAGITVVTDPAEI